MPLTCGPYILGRDGIATYIHEAHILTGLNESATYVRPKLFGPEPGCHVSWARMIALGLQPTLHAHATSPPLRLLLLPRRRPPIPRATSTTASAAAAAAVDAGMDLRRPTTRSSSGGVEPRYRQVGFVTTTAEPAAAAASSSSSPRGSDVYPGSLSPVMIPPPRIPDHLTALSPAPVSLLPSSPPPPSSSRLDAAESDLDDDDDDDVDVSWARPPPPALLGMRFAASKSDPSLTNHSCDFCNC